MTARNWCFTYNNPTVTDDNNLFESCPSNLKLKLGITQLERGEATGTIHYQGYLELKTPVRLAALKNWLPTAHWEKRMGTRLQAIQYCMKEDTRLTGTQPITFGIEGSLDDYVRSLTECPSSHSQTNLLELKGMIDSGCTEIQLAEHDFNNWARHFRALERYRMLRTVGRSEPSEVIVVVGPTGTGKSRLAMEYENSYWKQKSIWWDGYSNQDTVILDEFYGWLPWDTLLRLCDRYPLLVETKGGQTQFTSKRIIITSNLPPARWYKNQYMEALYRRISKFIIMPTSNTKLEFSNFIDAEEHLERLTFILPTTE
jgi:RNA helicase./Putative viral replication protein.